MTGTVVEWNNERGFGFIKPDVGRRKVFVYFRQITSSGRNSLSIGESVQFEMGTGRDGRPAAVNVSIISASNQPVSQMTAAPESSSVATIYKATYVKTLHSSSQSVNQAGNEEFPYDFVMRDPEKSRKHKPEATHEKLLDGHYDIAFEIEWTTLTPTAANPCIDTNPEVGESPSGRKEGEYAGYNKRWLMIDNKLAISPFTVKSAIANGFANLLGGCYRVNTKKERHKDSGKGKYLYGGRYKRYRVAMDGSSKPGIVTDIQVDTETGDRNIKVIPVKEFYLDEGLSDLNQGAEVYAQIVANKENKEREKKHKPLLIKICNEFITGCIKVKYHGTYFYRMESKNHKHHKHRFYQECDVELSGRIPAINFIENKEALKEYVSLGGADPNGEPKEWFQKLDDIEKDSFVYFEAFNGKITNIGKNFLFKTLFLHEDTVSGSNIECKDIALLCPRCSMFGMTDKSEDEEREIVGFKGRFKASTLVNEKKLTKSGEKCSVTVFENGKFMPRQVDITSWVDDNNNTICKQYPLPIQGEPKPNKRDVGGYYDKNTGAMRGAKYYYHAMVDIDRLVNDTNAKQDLKNEKPEYSHELRNFAEVLSQEEAFTGTVGAENCTIEEIAALIILLRSDIGNHGFKIGLGKAFGMGSISSMIKTMWIRKPENYNKWVRIDNIDKSSVPEIKNIIESHLKGIKKELKTLDKVRAKLNSLEHMCERRLAYPMPVQKENNRKIYYWDIFNRKGS